jgi:hypothetical protein
MEAIMKRGLLVIVLSGMLLTVAACVVEPYGVGTGYFYGGSHYEHNYGRPVWNQ